MSHNHEHCLSCAEWTFNDCQICNTCLNNGSMCPQCNSKSISKCNGGTGTYSEQFICSECAFEF